MSFIERSDAEKLQLIRALHLHAKYNEWEFDTDYFYDNVGRALDGHHTHQDELQFVKSCYEELAKWLVKREVKIIHHSSTLKDDVELTATVIDHYEDRVIIYLGNGQHDLSAEETNEIERVPVSVEAICNFDELKSEYEKEVQHTLVHGEPLRSFEESCLHELEEASADAKR